MLSGRCEGALMTSRHPSLPPIKPAGGQSGNSSGTTHGVLGRSGFAFWRKKSPEWTALPTTLADSGNCCLDVNLCLNTSFDHRRDCRRHNAPMLNFGSKELGRTVSGKRPKQMGVSKTAEAQLRRSDYFVAKDFTNHFNLHAQSIATVGKSETHAY